MVKIYDLVGTGFTNRGRDVKSGLDCWGLTMEVFKRYGIQLPDFDIDAFKYKEINNRALIMLGDGAWVEVRHPKDSDVPLVVLMQFHQSFITHVGVFIGNNKIIHTMKHTGAVISRTSALKSNIVGYYRPCFVY